MLRSVTHAAEHAVRCRSSTRQQILNGSCWPHDSNLRHRTWIGCSHWTTPFRPFRAISNGSHSDQGNTLADDSEQTSLEEGEGQTADIDQDAAFVRNADAFPGIDAQSEGIIVDRVASTKLNRPQLPSSIKKLNRLLSHDRSIDIPDSDLLERFVKGRGPGGQAINKTNSSVSLTHIPTGIRIQAQPTRSREENRKIARKILAERLDLLRAHEAARLAPHNEREEEAEGLSRKEKEKGMAKVWSREEIRWEKERRRKVNKAKKNKKKRKVGMDDPARSTGDTEEEEG